MKKCILSISLLISYNLFGAALPTENKEKKATPAEQMAKVFGELHKKINEKVTGNDSFMQQIVEGKPSAIYLWENLILNEYPDLDYSHQLQKAIRIWNSAINKLGGEKNWHKLPMEPKKNILKRLLDLDKKFEELENRSAKKIKEASEQAITEMTGYIQEGTEGQLPTDVEDIIRQYSMQIRKSDRIAPTVQNYQDDDNNAEDE